ncbi:Endonuclease/exonuclease/phosphatase [Trinorchestia longiramus]|nr:Endonuclease/exonuclease/phosphatase [Trinorchestia longiramus]
MDSHNYIKSLTIIQHNVLNWQNNKIALCSIYRQYDPHIILLNAHCLRDNTPIKIWNYNTYTANKANEQHAGTAIAIRKDVPFKLHDNFHTDMLGVTVETPQGPITIGTTYIPPRTNFINYIDMHTLLRRQNPTYLLADMNARHPTLGYNNTNIKGKQIHSLINKNKCIHIGPNFPTLLTHNSSTSPDIVLTNTQTFHNIRLQPGPLTPSDHIPIIATITANPIQIPIRPRPSFHNANWTQYKRLLTEHTVPQDPLPTLEEIDNHLSNWESHITAASNQAIPTITHRTIPEIKPTHETLLLQTRYQYICCHLRRHGHSPHLYRELRKSKTERRRNTYTERKKQRETQRERDTHTERKRLRERERERETEKISEREREKERDTERKTHRQREAEKKRLTPKKNERKRKRDIEIEKEKEKVRERTLTERETEKKREENKEGERGDTEKEIHREKETEEREKQCTEDEILVFRNICCERCFILP